MDIVKYVSRNGICNLPVILTAPHIQNTCMYTQHITLHMYKIHIHTHKYMLLEEHIHYHMYLYYNDECIHMNREI